MDLTNDEYHDILDAIKAAKADFRYANQSEDGNVFEVEAYQITPRSRFENAEWPIWLQMQKSPAEVNKLYCESSSPNDLTLMMVGGVEQPLGATDWVVLYKNGDMTVVPDRDFQHFDKVVPVPDSPVVPESAPGFEEKFELDENNKLIPRKTPLTVVPTIIEEDVSLVTSEDTIILETYVIDALEMLQNDKADLAEEALVKALSGRVKWCGCSPGKCDKSQTLGCRVESPLVK